MLGHVVKLRNDHNPSGKGWGNLPRPPVIGRYLQCRCCGQLTANPYQAIRTSLSEAKSFAKRAQEQYPGAMVTIEPLE